MSKLNWYSINITSIDNNIVQGNTINSGDILFNGYFVINNDTNEIIGVYENNYWSNNLLLPKTPGNYTFYQQSTNQTAAVIIKQSGEIIDNNIYTNNIENYNPYNENTIQIINQYDNVYKNNWKQFDYYGLMVKNMSFFQYTPNTEYSSISFSANKLGDENTTNIGTLTYSIQINNIKYTYSINVNFNIQFMYQITVPELVSYIQWTCTSSANVLIQTADNISQTFSCTAQGTGSDEQSSKISAYDALQVNINDFLLENPNTTKSTIEINESIPVKQIILRDKYMSDFDGTLMKGYIDGVSPYHESVSQYLYSIGMVNSTIYPTWEVYSSVQNTKLANNDTTAFLMAFEIYNSNQDPYIEQYWESTLQNYFVDYTRILLMSYNLQGYQVCIISGSPYIYTKYLTTYLPVQNIVGPIPNGLITYAVGKVTYAKQYVGKYLTSLAGYVGDTWGNDGPLLSAAKNYYDNSDCQFILHGQQNGNDTTTNLTLYNIKQIYAY